MCLICNYRAVLLTHPESMAYQLTVTCSKSTMETLESCEKCLKLTIKTTERCHWHRSGVFIFIFGHISHLFIVFLFLTLNK